MTRSDSAHRTAELMRDNADQLQQAETMLHRSAEASSQEQTTRRLRVHRVQLPIRPLAGELRVIDALVDCAARACDQGVGVQRDDDDLRTGDPATECPRTRADLLLDPRPRRGH